MTFHSWSCIRCFHCLDYGRCSELACSVNPIVGRETKLNNEIMEVKEKKNIIVIGGGPAGMEAAIVAKKRGHEVTIYEKTDRLGGILKIFDNVSFKKDLIKFRNYLIHMVDKLKIRVELNTEMTMQKAKELKPDVIVVAVGSKDKMPNTNNKNVISAKDAIDNPKKIKGNKIVVVGGGETGCETAVYLAKECKKDVSLVSRSRRLAKSSGPIASSALMKNLDKYVSEIYVGTECVGIENNGVIVEQFGMKGIINADTIVIATGVESMENVAKEYENLGIICITIGDCKNVGNVRTAIRSAYDAMIEI